VRLNNDWSELLGGTSELVNVNRVVEFEMREGLAEPRMDFQAENRGSLAVKQISKKAGRGEDMGRQRKQRDLTTFKTRTAEAPCRRLRTSAWRGNKYGYRRQRGEIGYDVGVKGRG